jgi:hypothetical protein
VLDRTTRYVEDFVRRFANVVAEERYIQTANPSNPGPGPSRRELVSDFLLVKIQGGNDWYQFRDVREVDGKPVRDRDKRLTALFLEPWDTALAQATTISRESARYNLTDVGAVNYPLLATAFLQRHYVDRFEFTVGRIEQDRGAALRVINFRERNTTTTILGGVRASGEAWVDEATGRVMKTALQLRSGQPRFAIEITTTFAFDDRLQVAVPVEMRDSYPTALLDMTGVATYGRFRSFEVRTEEKVRQP